MDKKVYSGIMILVGAAIGAGFQAIPYGIAKVGVLLGVLQLILVCIVTAVMCFYVAELIFKTHKKQQVVGLIGNSLGKKGKYMMTVAMFVGVYGALSAYGVGTTALMRGLFGGSYVYHAIVLFSVTGYIIYKGIHHLDRAEVMSMSLLIPVMLILSVLTLQEVDVSNLVYTNISNFFYPFGILLFSCFAYQSIPEISKITKKDNLRRIIILGTITFAVLYAVFATSFVGAFGEGVSQIAVESINPRWMLFGYLISILAMFTSFLVLGLVMKDTYIDDYEWGKNKSFLLALAPPFIITLMRPDFSQIVGFTGAVSGGFVGLLLGIAVYYSRKQHPTPKNFTPGGTPLIIISTALFLMMILSELVKYI